MVAILETSFLYRPTVILLLFYYFWYYYNNYNMCNRHYSAFKKNLKAESLDYRLTI